MPGAVRCEDVQAGFGGAGAEGREARIADLRGDAIGPRMPGRGVVEADPGRVRKAGAQDRLVLGDEAIERTAQEPHHLSLGDRQPIRFLAKSPSATVGIG
ncbi:hypothetical protein [uncultured Methylobacterium sp.]|uniref:hypothetical protein n=1 Tax=uncultured Methylobacterium sp. TaxID=157278 RepID=UPI0035CAF5DE